MERWLRTMSAAPNRIRVGQNLLEALDLKRLKRRRGRLPRRFPLRAGNDNLPDRFDDRVSS